MDEEAPKAPTLNITPPITTQNSGNKIRAASKSSISEMERM